MYRRLGVKSGSCRYAASPESMDLSRRLHWRGTRTKAVVQNGWSKCNSDGWEQGGVVVVVETLTCVNPYMLAVKGRQ